jgi:peptide/nickel transport system permease protein
MNIPLITYSREKFRLIFKRPTGILCIAFLMLLTILSVLANWIAPSPLLIVGPPYAPPFGNFIFGTDDLGRDIFAMVIHGMRTTIYVAVTSITAASIIGVLLGAFAGFFGGKVDLLIMRITELAMLLPRTVFVLILVVVLGQSISNVILAILITGWPTIALITRSEFISLKERAYVEASKALGESKISIMFKEILPNCFWTIFTVIITQISLAAIIEAATGYLGLSDPNVPSIGLMLRKAQTQLRIAPWGVLIPGALLTLFIVDLNLLSDLFAEAFNPRLKIKKLVW